MRYEVEIAGQRRTVDVRRVDGRFTVTLGDRTWRIDASLVDRHTLSLLLATPEGPSGDALGGPTIGGESHDVTLVPERVGGGVTVLVGTASMRAVLNGRRRPGSGEASEARTGPQRIVAPMPGKVVRLLVAPGQAVEARQGLVVVEAMKMENELRATRAGRVSELAVRVGQSVDAGVLLAVIVDDAPEA